MTNDERITNAKFDRGGKFLRFGSTGQEQFAGSAGHGVGGSAGGSRW
jgi:hypothetical protein